jgi:hypothetical protein
MSKKPIEMNEGPGAYTRFRDAMKAIVSVPKSSVLPEKSKEEKAPKTSDASRVSRDPESGT